MFSLPEFCSLLGLRDLQIADGLGITRQAAGNYLRGARVPNDEMKMAIADWSGGFVTPNDILGVDGNRLPDPGKIIIVGASPAGLATLRNLICLREGTL